MIFRVERASKAFNASKSDHEIELRGSLVGKKMLHIMKMCVTRLTATNLVDL